MGNSRQGVMNKAGKIRQWAERLPRPLRFIGVGGAGLLTDLSVFTVAVGHGAHPLGARLLSLAVATLVTWRLNRAVTFDLSHRRQHDEAVRYALVTAAAQGTSYAIFAVLVLTILQNLPQAALLIGAAVGGVIAYTGHRLFAFAPRRSQPSPRRTMPTSEKALRA